MRIIISILLLLGTIIANAQIKTDSIKLKKDSLIMKNLSIMSTSLQNDYRVEKPNIIPSSPQSKLFEKYLNHKITEYNGLPKIEIPLFDIEIKGLKIPVVLSYHAGGIKYKQFDGDVGVGWTLNIGGYKVSRDIRGRADERFNKYDESEFRYEVEDNYQLSRGDAYLGSIGLKDLNSNTATTLVNGKFKYQDGENDIFNYMLPSTGGKFIITDRDEYMPGMISKAIALEENNDLIQPMSEFDRDGNNNIIKFEIKDDKGFVYIAGGKQNNMIIAEYPSSETESAYTSWPLLQILSPYNEAIKFSYIYQQIKYEKDKARQLNITDAATGSTIDDENTSSSASIYVQEKKYYSYQYSYQYMIDKVEGEDFTILFDRTEGLESDMIASIKLYDTEKNLVKKIKFDYDKSSVHYFLKSVSLGKLENIESKYSFEYYPNSGSGIDQWGYYKTQQHSTYPDMSLHNEFKSNIFTSNAGKLNPGTSAFQKDITIEDAQYIPQFSTLKNCNWTDRTENLKPYSYSLKKITYPTGGSTEYIYEPHQYKELSKLVTGGGQRVKQIISRHSLDSKPIVTEYNYGENKDGIGIPNLDFDYRNFYNETYIYDVLQESSQHGIGRGISKYTARKYSSRPISMSAEISNFNISYDKVYIYQYDNGNYNGHIESSYNIPKIYEQDASYMPFFEFYSFLDTWTAPCNNSFYNYITGYNWADKPLIQSRTVFDANNKIKNEERYFYYDSKHKVDTIENVNVFQKLFGNLIQLESNINDRYCVSNSFFDYYKYNLYTGKYDLISRKETTSYDNNGNSLSTVETYDYNANNQLTKKTQIDNGLGNVERIYTYPMDYPYGTETEIIEENVILHEMISKNIVSNTIEQITLHNGAEISRVKTNYSNTPHNIIMPSYIETSTSGPSKMRKELTYDLYDQKGNLLQYTTLEGKTNSYLWSYNYKYPVAEIQNATYNDVKNKLSINADQLAKSMVPNMSAINNLRTALPTTYISTYTYKPMVGITTSTDPTGLTTYYEYDDFNRLKWTKDNKLNYTSFYKYNYTNEPIQYYETLEMTEMQISKESFEQMESGLFTITTKGGSGNFMYNWTLYDMTDGMKKIHQISDGKTNSISLVLKNKGKMRIECQVVDIETGIKEGLQKNFEVLSYLELKLSNNTQYAMTDVETFTVTLARGSGKYSYDWYIKDSQNNTILSQINSSSNKFIVDFSKTKTGKLSVSCFVKDLETLKNDDISKTFEVDWLDLNMPVQTHCLISKHSTTSTFTISARGGSSNYRYDWYITADDDYTLYESNNHTSNMLTINLLDLGIGKRTIKCVVKDVQTQKQSKQTKEFVVQKVVSFSDITSAYSEYPDGTSSSVQQGFIYNPLSTESVKIRMTFSCQITNGARVEYLIGDKTYVIQYSPEYKSQYIDVVLPAGYTPVSLTLLKYNGMADASMELIESEDNPFVAIGDGSIEVNAN